MWHWSRTGTRHSWGRKFPSFSFNQLVARPRIKYIGVIFTSSFRCNSSSRCGYRAGGHVDPASSWDIQCGEDSHPEVRSSLSSDVGLARAHLLPKTQAREPSRRSRSSYVRSSYGSPLRCWSSNRMFVLTRSLSIFSTHPQPSLAPQEAFFLDAKNEQ